MGAWRCYNRYAPMGLEGQMSNALVTISIKGTTFTAVTAADGTWKITGLPQGTYTLTATRTGYFTYTDRAFRFVGHGDDHYPTDKSYIFFKYRAVRTRPVGMDHIRRRAAS
ncbi:MAG: CarboxypepD reg-like domain [Chlorobi bacterium]|nr:CarboxypepD reg-like domain [Chlorobiota bacterium]